MRRIVATGLIFAAAGASVPRIALAQTASRPALGVQRPSQPVSRPPGAGQGGGQAPAYRPPAGVPPNGSQGRPAKPPQTYYRPSGSNTNGYYNGYRGARVIVANPVYVRHPPWGWNRGVIWYPAPTYWGGGFWGPLTIGLTSAIVFGAVVNANHQTIVAYKVSPNSPGATMLKNYQLTQTPCGPPGLVVVFGPNDSVICAQPNHLVHPGTYDLDAQQLTIISR